MENLEALKSFDWIYIFFGVVALLVAGRFLIKLLIWYYKTIFGKVTEKTLKKMEFEKRIGILEDHDKWQYGAITGLIDKIDELIENNKINEERERVKTVAVLRTQLYSMHSKFMEQKCVDKEGLTTFIELGKIYKNNDGNDIYHSKLEPEVLSLPIKNS